MPLLTSEARTTSSSVVSTGPHRASTSTRPGSTLGTSISVSNVPSSSAVVLPTSSPAISSVTDAPGSQPCPVAVASPPGGTVGSSTSSARTSGTVVDDCRGAAPAIGTTADSERDHRDDAGDDLPRRSRKPAHAAVSPRTARSVAYPHRAWQAPGVSAKEIVLVRHGETEWAKLGRHTGRTDIPLTDDGRMQAELVGRRLDGRDFALVLTSPLGRAFDTCRLAGLAGVAEHDDDLLEWDYGEYEGRRTVDIRVDRPGLDVVGRRRARRRDGERRSAARVDRVIDRAVAADGDVALFAHGHVLRVLGARWLGLDPTGGRLFALSPATLSVLGYERETRVFLRWNDVCDPVVALQTEVEDSLMAVEVHGRRRAGRARGRVDRSPNRSRRSRPAADSRSR